MAKSISDDDLCSTCKNLEYRPGGMSKCKLHFPCDYDRNWYVIRCAFYDQCAKGENIVDDKGEG